MRRSSKKAGGRPAPRRGKEDLIRHYHPVNDTTLLPFLLEVLKDKNRTTVKALLAHRQVAINGRAITQFDTPLHPNDEVSVNFDRPFNFFRHPMLRIVFEDDSLIVVDKASGLLSMGTDTNRENTAYRILSDYVKRKDLRNRIFILHRLDKDTSGLMMFAKNPMVQTKLQSDWDNMILDRRYVAVIEGTPEKEQGELRSYLAENSAMTVYSTDEQHGKLAITQYRTMQSKGRYSLVELTLLTGRKNQIRVHMSEFGFPIAGDRKYGAATNPINRLMLHASRLQFIHPVTRENLIFETPVPAKFKVVF